MPITVGQRASRSLTLTPEHVRKFAEISGDHNPLHFDAAFNLNARGTLFTVQKALPLFNVFAAFTNRFVWYRCRWVRAWSSRPSRRPAPVLACRYTPGCSSVCHFER